MRVTSGNERRTIAAVRRLNAGGPVRRYPGSPWLIAEALRQFGGDTQQRFLAFNKGIGMVRLIKLLRACRII